MSDIPSALEPLYPEPGADLGSILDERLTSAAFDAAQAVVRCSRSLGIPSYAVGGPIRDMLLGRSVTDIDVVVEGDGISFAGELAAGEKGKMVEYARFGTALVVLPGGVKIDVATAREERYVKPGALPAVEPGSLDRDLLRRDFSINAMAVRLGPDEYGRFVDTYGGIRDLEAGLIRVMHDGSFTDDPTRILRAVRFETRYGFSIEDRTYRLLEDAVRSAVLAEVSRQRLREEIVAVLKEEEAHSAVSRLYEAGVWKDLFGSDYRLPKKLEERFQSADEAIVWYSELAEEHGLTGARPWLVRWLLLMSDTPLGTTERITSKFHLGRTALKSISELKERLEKVRRFLETGDFGSKSTLYRMMEGLAPETMIYTVAVSGREDTLHRIEQFLLELRPIEAWVNGNDLKVMGLPEGPLMGRLLAQLFDAQLDGIIRTREEAHREARKIVNNRSR